MKQGIEQEKIKVAKNLLSQKVAKDIISMATGLSIEEINNLE